MSLLTAVLALLTSCASPPQTQDTSGLTNGTDCGDDLTCDGSCPAGPAQVEHAAWWNRLSESPPLTFSAVDGAIRYQISVGRAPGLTDVGCWTDVELTDGAQHLALWGVRDGDVLYSNVRAVLQTGVSQVTSSQGWTLDIQPPAIPTDLHDGEVPVTGEFSWAHDGLDVASGFSHYEVRAGTAPGSDDELQWIAVEDATSVTLDPPWVPESWHWLQVRAVDLAGNPSQPATSSGFITCPASFVYVPENDDLGNAAFCAATYEMKIVGMDDGDQPHDPNFVAQSRPEGTPWVNMDKESARTACDALGFGYQLLTTRQWQSVARSIEQTSVNWSSGVVGEGEVNRGHSDRLPFNPLPTQVSDPCHGTDNPQCTDPLHADFQQKRTHHLHNGEQIWDFAGNVWEQVDGSLGGPDTLWVSFDHSAFTTEDGWESHREQFAPAGPYTEGQGIGRMYGGAGNLIRGGCFNYSNPGVAGSSGIDDMGIYASHHNAWDTGPTHGFRCAFTPM